MIPTPIALASDRRLDAFRNLKGQAGRADGTFVAESEIVLERLFDSGIVIRVALITPARAARLAETLETSVAARTSHPVEVFVAEQRVIDDVVGYPLHRGVIALAERPKLPTVEALLGSSHTVVVLEGVMDPDNVGSVFRHAAGFGVDAVILHGHTGDPLYRKTIRTSMGWTLSVPYARSASEDPGIGALLARHGFVSFALTPARTAARLADALDDVIRTGGPSARIAFLLGAEGPGLSDDLLSSADHRVRIPLADGVDSLNIATAAAIALYALGHAQPSRLGSRRHP